MLDINSHFRKYAPPGQLIFNSKAWLFALAVGCLLAGPISCGLNEEFVGDSPEFAPEVEKVLQDKVLVVNRLVMADPGIVESIRESNRRNQGIAMSEIRELDERWRAPEEVDSMVSELASREASRLLMEFQDTHEGYAEIFITDANGLLVALTNRTSDYYQADEGWWVKTYNGGQGMPSHGDLEYDESAAAEAIAMYVPIIDPETMTSIGVMKVLVDIAAIKMAL